MDTIHDLGGREGFGPVRWHHDDKLFPEPWQARTWAACMQMFARFRREQAGWTLDWHRHVLERIAPADYLAMNYFDKWVQAMMAVLIDDGTADIEEFVGGRSRRAPPAGDASPPATGAEPGAARYAAGAAVVTKRSVAAMHTRLPGYARGRKGVIERHIGPEPLADASAAGEIRREHLYTVRFEAAELWPGSAGRVGVHLDLWESYLEPA